MKGSGVTFLINHSLFPQIMLAIIFSLLSLLFCLSVAAQQANVYFKTLSHVFILGSPTRWFHLSTSCFSTSPSSLAALIPSPRHSHQVKSSLVIFLLCCYKVVRESPEEWRRLQVPNFLDAVMKEIIAYPQALALAYIVNSCLSAWTQKETESQSEKVTWIHLPDWDDAFSYYSTFITLHWV